MVAYGELENGSTSAAQTPLRALVISSTMVERVFNTYLLAISMFQVVQATNLRQAIDMMLEGEMFDLVIIGVRMSGMNGVEAVMTIREMNRGTIIVGAGVEEYEAALMRAGVNKFITKPLTREKISEIKHEFNLIR